MAPISDPYESPQSPTAERLKEIPLVTRRATAFSFGSMFVGCVFGGLLGFILGALVPKYYRSVVFNGNDPNFDPVSFGVGQGMIQGAIVGLFAGIAILGVSYFLRYKPMVRKIAKGDE